MGFFKSFFSGKPENPEAEKQKNDQKNFEIFKYDGMRAQRMGRTDYAIKCFTEALKLQDDFETMGYLAQVYIQTNQLDEARRLLETMTRHDSNHTATYLALANVCYMQEDYPAMAEAAQKAIAIEEGNAMAHYLLGKADNGQGDDLMCIAHLTQAIVLKDDFTEARLLRAEALTKMYQYKEAMEDINAILAQNDEDESALLLRGKIKEATGDTAGAEADFMHVTELNPFNEQGIPMLGPTLHRSKEADRSHCPLRRSHRVKPQLRPGLSRTRACQTAERRQGRRYRRHEKGTRVEPQGKRSLQRTIQ